MTDPNQPGVSLSNESLNYLKESGSWGSFLAIVGFCVVALLVCGGLFAGTLMSTMGGGEDMGGIASVMVGAIYVILGGVYLFPVLYLYKFSQEIKNALTRNSTEAMTAAMSNLKSLLKFMGIFTVIYLGLVVLMLLGAGALGMFF